MYCLPWLSLAPFAAAAVAAALFEFRFELNEVKNVWKTQTSYIYMIELNRYSLVISKMYLRNIYLLLCESIEWEMCERPIENGKLHTNSSTSPNYRPVWYIWSSQFNRCCGVWSRSGFSLRFVCLPFFVCMCVSTGARCFRLWLCVLWCVWSHVTHSPPPAIRLHNWTKNTQSAAAAACTLYKSYNRARHTNV